MEANKLRLNQQKRQLLKREWASTVWNKTPMEVEDNLKLAIENYRTVKQQTWDNVITPCLLYTSPSPRDRTRSRMPSSA